MILVPFFEIPHMDRLAKNVKSRCVQIIPRSAPKQRKNIIKRLELDRNADTQDKKIKYEKKLQEPNPCTK